eukprot:72774_1
MSAFILTLLYFKIIVAEFYSCDDTITGFISNIQDSHNHVLYIGYGYHYMNINPCNSELNVNITIIDDNGSRISSQNCGNHNICRKCNNTHEYTQNYSIPIIAGKYNIIVQSAMYGSPHSGRYQIAVSCSNHHSNISETNHCNIYKQDSVSMGILLLEQSEWSPYFTQTYSHIICLTR